MFATCEHARAIGLRTLFFTEHLDLEPNWLAAAEDFPPWNGEYIGVDGVLRPPMLDVEGYFKQLDECREAFPELDIRSGLEFGQPHRYGDLAVATIDLARFDRVLGSLHTLAVEGGFAEPVTLYRSWAPHRVVREYMLELERMPSTQLIASVVTHLDYAVRSWPVATAGPFDPTMFEPEIRAAMTAIAAADLALEMNTRRLWPWLPRWWRECGGTRVTFGSDAHVPEALANGFAEAAEMLESLGFGPGRSHADPWEVRTRVLA